MYKLLDKLQHSSLDFKQPMGLHMNPDNRWFKMAGHRIVYILFYASLSMFLVSNGEY